MKGKTFGMYGNMIWDILKYILIHDLANIKNPN